MENGKLKRENAWDTEATRVLLIIIHFPFVIFPSRVARTPFGGMDNGELKMDNAWRMEAARALPIIIHFPFVIFPSRVAREGGC
jgi:hypothetical protein